MKNPLLVPNKKEIPFQFNCVLLSSNRESGMVPLNFQLNRIKQIVMKKKLNTGLYFREKGIYVYIKYMQSAKGQIGKLQKQVVWFLKGMF